MPEPSPPKLLIVDTNSYLRLFHSPVGPLLGVEIGGLQLVVIRELADEFFKSPRLKNAYPWVNESPKKEELLAPILKLKPAVAASIEADAITYRDECNAVLDAHCRKMKTAVPRTISLCDAKALTTALEIGADLVTDEWPLRHVAEAVDPDDAGNKLKVLSTLDVLAHLEKAGRLSADVRRVMVKDWLHAGEHLPNNWRKQYQEHFQEAAPTFP